MRILLKLSLFVSMAALIHTSEALADHPTIGFGSSNAGPVTTITSSTLPKGALGVDVRAEYLSFDAYSDSELREFSEKDIDTHSTDSLLSSSVGLAYGFSGNLTFSLRIPYIKRSGIREGAHAHDNGNTSEETRAEASHDDDHRALLTESESEIEVHNHGDITGLGDMTLMAQYRFRDESDLSSSLIAGLRIPTGKTNAKTEDGEEIETEHQPGSGAWNPIIGVTVSSPFDSLSVDANLLYTFAMKGSQDATLGALLNYNVALSYGISGGRGHYDDGHDHHHHDKNGTLFDVVMEINGEWRGKDKVDDVTSDNSGGNVVMLSPGVRASFGGKWSAFLSGGLPIIQNLNGEQHNTLYRILAGIGGEL